MTPAEFKEARHRLGLSCAKLAALWGMGANGGRTIRRWEAGDVPVNPIAAYCINMMVDRRESGSVLRTVSGEPVLSSRVQITVGK